MTDIAKLGYSVDSTQVKQGTADLDAHAAAALKTAAASKTLDAAFASRAAAVASANTASQQGSKISQQLTQDVMNGEHAVKLSNFQLANMSFQINDIAASLASGQSPFRVLYQQGAQIAQIFGPGVGIRGALATTGTAITTFLTNPLNIAVLGFAAAAGAAGMFFDFLFSGSSKSEGVLKKHEDAVKQLKAAYEDLANGKAASMSNVAIKYLGFSDSNQLQQQLQKQLKELSTGAGPFSGNSLVGFASYGGALGNTLKAFFEDMRKGTGDVTKLNDALKTLALNDPTNKWLQEMVTHLLSLTSDATKSAEALRELNAAMSNGAGYADRYAEGLEKIKKAIPSLNTGDVKLTELNATYTQALADLRKANLPPEERMEKMVELDSLYKRAIPEVTGASDAVKTLTKSTQDFIALGQRAELKPLEQSLQAVRDRAREMKEDIDKALKIPGLTDTQKATLNAMAGNIDASTAGQIKGLRVDAADKAGAKAGRTEEKFTQGIEDTVRKLRLEAETLGMSKSAAAQYRMEKDALAEATQRHITLSDTEKEYLHDLTLVYGDLTLQVERFNNAKQAGNYIASSLLDAIQNANSLEDALKRVALALVQAAIQAQFLGTGPFAGLFGTQTSGGVFGSAFAGLSGIVGAFLGGFDRGGNIPLGSSGYVGESDMERIDVTPAGAKITPISRRTSDSGSRREGLVINNHIYVEGATGSDEVKKMIEIGVATGVGKAIQENNKNLPAMLNQYQVEKA